LHGSRGSAIFASRLKGATDWAKVDNDKHIRNVFLQELDSKDKIGTQLQPRGREYLLCSPSASQHPSQPIFAAFRSAPFLAFKGLAIMNFL